jgi:hypothetical protein
MTRSFDLPWSERINPGVELGVYPTAPGGCRFDVLLPRFATTMVG